MRRTKQFLLLALTLCALFSISAAQAQNFGGNSNYYSPGYRNYQSGFGGGQPQTYQSQQAPQYQYQQPQYQQPQYQQPQYQQPSQYQQPQYQQRSQYQYNQPSYQPHTTMNSLEHELDQVDSNWNQVPVSQQPARTAYTQQPRYNSGPQQVSRGRRAVAPGSGPMMGAWQGMFPGVSKQELMRVFLEGGTPDAPGTASAPDMSGQYASARSTAYSNYQQASNEASKARNDANTAHYDHDKWNRKNAASRAEYAANNAEYAAERAESAANSGDAQARSYAGMAREAANRARASANQARYNANTIQ